MLELFKLLWDAIVLRDAARKGQLSWRTWVYGFGFAVLIYAIGLPAGLLYINHPQYKPLFIAAMIADGILVVSFIVWGIKRQARQRAAQLQDSAGTANRNEQSL